MPIEDPAYSVFLKQDNHEVRDYAEGFAAEGVAAEVAVTGGSRADLTPALPALLPGSPRRATLLPRP